MDARVCRTEGAVDKLITSPSLLSRRVFVMCETSLEAMGTKGVANLFSQSSGGEGCGGATERGPGVDQPYLFFCNRKRNYWKEGTCKRRTREEGFWFTFVLWSVRWRLTLDSLRCIVILNLKQTNFIQPFVPEVILLTRSCRTVNCEKDCCVCFSFWCSGCWWWLPDN